MSRVIDKSGRRVETVVHGKYCQPRKDINPKKINNDNLDYSFPKSGKESARKDS